MTVSKHYKPDLLCMLALFIQGQIINYTNRYKCEYKSAKKDKMEQL